MAASQHTTRRALFAGATLIAAAVDLPAEARAKPAAAPSSAAEQAYKTYRARMDAFEARRGVSDDEVDAFVDAIAPVRDAISEAPCDSKSAAIAKLRHLHEEIVAFHECGDHLVAQVLLWVETL